MVEDKEGKFEMAKNSRGQHLAFSKDKMYYRKISVDHKNDYTTSFKTLQNWLHNARKVYEKCKMCWGNFRNVYHCFRVEEIWSKMDGIN